MIVIDSTAHQISVSDNEELTTMRFEKQVVVVTGGSSGIGLATVKAFAKEGAIVAINDLHEESIDKAIAEVESAGGSAFGVVGDVSQQEQVRANVSQILEKCGHIDVLISNAGLPSFEPAEAYTTWKKSLSVNLDGHFFWAQTVATRSMISRKKGAIIFTSALAGLAALPGDIGYVTCKHGLSGLTKGLAVEWAKYGLRVNSVAPGLTDSLMVRKNIPPDSLAEHVKRIPMGRIGQPEELAHVMLFLASDDASFISGLTVPVDGGQMGLLSGTLDTFPPAEHPDN